MKNRIFTSEDIGCWVDGSFGDDYLRGRLVDMLDTYFPEDHTHYVQPGIWITDCPPCIANRLHVYRSDDAEEIYEAVSLLESITDENVTWILEAGDLILTTLEQAIGL